MIFINMRRVGMYLLAAALCFNCFISSAQNPLEFDGDVILKNYSKIQFRNSSELLDGTEIVRYSGNAMRFRFASNSLNFDALDNQPVQVRNSDNTPQIQLHPAGPTYFNGGNVGIGYTSPLYPLHVKGTALFTDGGGDALMLYPDSDNRQGIVSSNFKLAFIADKVNTLASDKKIIFGAGGATPDATSFLTYMVIDQGKVGVGTVSPQERLHVGGAGYFHNDIGGIKIDAVSNNQENGYIRSSLLSSRDGDLKWNDQTLKWEIGTGSSNDFAGIIHRGYGEIGFVAGKSGSMTTPLTNAEFKTNFQHMTITGDGQVGIGTTDPYNAGSSNNPGLQNTVLSVLGAVTFGETVPSTETNLPAITQGSSDGTAQDLLIGTRSGSGKVRFFTGNASSPNGTFGNSQNAERLTILAGGNVGIGTTTPDAKLTVKGVIHTQEVKVDLSVPGPDYVFEENYPLSSLEETKAYIEQNKHLPGIPSSAEMQQNGVNLLEMNMKLLEKVEELTLYQIQSMEEIKDLKKEIAALKKK